MRIVTSIVFLGILSVIILAGAKLIPGFYENGSMPGDTRLTLYIELLSFLVTVAVIGPLTAQFLKWQENKEWQAARVNSYILIGRNLQELEASYVDFFEKLIPEMDEKDLGRTIEDIKTKLSTIVAICDIESPCFTPKMHSHISEIRYLLSISAPWYDALLEVYHNAAYQFVFPEHSAQDIAHFLRSANPSTTKTIDQNSIGSLKIGLYSDGRVGTGQHSAGRVRFFPIHWATIKKEWGELSRKFKGKCAINEFNLVDDDPKIYIRKLIFWTRSKHSTNTKLRLVFNDANALDWEENIDLIF